MELRGELKHMAPELRSASVLGAVSLLEAVWLWEVAATSRMLSCLFLVLVITLVGRDAGCRVLAACDAGYPVVRMPVCSVDAPRSLEACLRPTSEASGNAQVPRHQCKRLSVLTPIARSYGASRQ